MSKRDNKVVELEENNKEEKTDATPIRKLVKRKISFDVYFSMLMKKRPGIFPHHKAPMRKYAENKGLVEGTEEEFDRIFRLY